MHVLDQQHAGRLRRGAFHDVGQRLAFALLARVVVHRIVDVVRVVPHDEQVGEIERMVPARALLRECLCERVAPHGCIAMRRNVEEAAEQRMNRVLALAGAEIEDRRRMPVRALGQRGRHERLGEARFAHAGLRDELHHRAAARRRGVGEKCLEAPAFDFASHERRACATGRAQRAQLP